MSRRSLVRRSVTRRKQVSRRLDIERAEERVVLTTWTELGPAPIDNGQIAGNGVVSGRLTGIAADPNDANTIYVASAGGGVWKTINGGASWTPLTDNLTDGSGNPIPEFMGAVAETDAVGGAHNGQQIVYAGTGEANNSGDSFYGSGILVSTNGGNTWTLTTAGGALTGRTVSKIAIDPTDSTGATAYAAVGDFAVNGNFGNTGIYKTTNFGQTWTNVTKNVGLTSSDPWSDVVIDPNNGHIYAAVGNPIGSSSNGVYESTDHGATWTLLSGSGSVNGTQDGRISLAVFDQSATDELFVSIEDPNSGGLLKMLKSTDGGTSFTDLTSNVLAASDYLNPQGWYDTTLGIDPLHPNIIYAAGVMSSQGPTFDGSPIMSIDGGTTWQTITTDSAGNSPHTDSHALAFDKNGNVLEGNDGGIWRLENTGTLATQTWTDLNSNLATIQFSGIAVNPLTGQVYGGSQDNGTETTNGSLGWTRLMDGDGGFVRIDPTNPNIVYGEFADPNDLQVSFDGGTTFNFIGGPPTNTSSNFYAPYVLDASGNLYYGGDGVYLSKNHGTTFTQIGTAGSNGFNTSFANIDAIAVSQTNNNVVYVSANGQIFATQNAQAANPTWTAVTLPGGGAVGAGNGITVDSSDLTGATAYAVVNSFGSQRVFKTTNFGASWTNVTGDLPNTPVWSVAVSPDGGTIYVGTDIGVYTSSNGGVNWTVMGSGMPQAQVVELVDVAGTNTLYAGTHGRGAWSISTLAAPPSLTIAAGPVTYISAGGPVALAAGASLTNGNPSYATGNLTVQITNNGSTFDQLVIQNTGGITVAGANVSFNGNVIGTFVGGTGGAPLVVTFTTAFANATSVQALIRAIDFNNSAVTPTTLQRTVQFTVFDGTNVTAPQNVLVNVQLAGPVLDFSGVTPITYIATSPPSLIAPTANVTDTVTPNFNGGQLAVTISANSSATDKLSITNAGLITVAGTTVSYNGNAFGTFSGGTGATPLVVVFNTAFATTPAIQALVRAIAFSNTAITPSTQTRTLSFQLTDSQPVTSAAATTQVNVQLAQPTITLAGPAPLTFTEDGPPVLIAPGATVSDPLATLMGGQLEVQISANASVNDQLLILNQGTGPGQIGVSGATVTYGGLVIGTFTGGQANSPLTITFTTSDATVAAVQALVQDIAFNNNSDTPSTLQRSITLQLFDSQPAASTPVSVPLNVVQVDNPPIINLNAVVATWTEGTPPVTLASGATVTYNDDTNFATGSLTVSLPVNGTPSDQLTIQAVGGITLSGSNVLFNGTAFGTFTGGSNGNPLIVSFSNTNATVAATQALIRAIGFSNSSINPSTLPRTVEFVINDGHGKSSSPVTMTVDLGGIDNPPTLVLGASLPYLSNTPPSAIASAATVTDPDSPFFTGGSLVVTEAAGSVNDILTVINQGKGANQISVSGASVFDAGTLIGTITSFGSSVSPLSISLNGSASVGDVQDLVRAIGFGISGAASSQTRAFTFTLNDGGGAAPVSQSTTVAVNVGKVPPLVIQQPTVNYSAGNSPVTISPNATVSDPDSATLNGGSLAVSIAQGVTINDRLSIQSQGTGLGQVMVSGLNVYYSGTLVGTLSSGGGIGLDPLVVSFNQQSSAAAAQAILSAVQFSTTGPNSSGPRLLQAIVIDDSQLPSTPALEQVNVSLPANPVSINLSSPSMNYLRGSGPTFIDAGATLTDVNATTFGKGSLTFQVHGGTKNHVAIATTIDIQVRAGKVKFDGVVIGTVTGGTVHLNANATAPAVQALIRAVTFSTNGSFGNRTATFVFHDGHGGTAFASKTIVVT
jgi:hypothetical protein